MSRRPAADRGPTRGSPSGHVLFVDSVSTLEGGAERSLLELATALRDRGWRVSLAAWGPGPLVEAFDRLGAAYVLGRGARGPASPMGGATTAVPGLGGIARAANALRLRLRPLGREARWLQTVVREALPDVVHTNCDMSPPAAARAAALHGLPWVAHLRDHWRAWLEPRTEAALRRADARIAPSQFLARRFRERGIDPVVVPNPIAGGALRRPLDPDERARLRAQLDPADGFLVAVVGRLDEQKGVLLLPEIVGHLGADGATPVRLLVAGRGAAPFERRLRAALDASGGADRVGLLGHRDDVARWLPAVDALLVPSAGEPFGRMIVEGMHAGLPVVAFRDGAAPELVEDGRTGLLVPPGDPAGMAGALRRLATEPELGRDLGRTARAEALRFEPAPIAGAVESLYRELSRT